MPSPTPVDLETIAVVIATTTATKAWDITVPVDIPIGHLIAKIIKEPSLDFAKRDQSGNDINYCLKWVEGKRFLEDYENLRLAGVKEGDTLVIISVDAKQQTNIASSTMFSVPILVPEQEREPIILIRTDRLQLMEGYRSEQNKWFSIGWAFIGGVIGIVVNWITSENIVISKPSIILIFVFAAIGFMSLFTARHFEKKAEIYIGDYIKKKLSK